MIAAMRALRRSEEGQALVLAAIFGLVLMLCVLGTVNLGRAVYDKVQLQAAADSAAYSQAAVEARVLNFTAYTNRAMVVHYASLMAATSYLTYLHFEWPFLKAALDLAKYLPDVGPAFYAVEEAVTGAMAALDAGVMALAPLLTAANIALYALQEGAWASVYATLSTGLPPEAHSGDTADHPYEAIWPKLIPLANAAVFAQTRGHMLLPEDTLETAKILLNDKSAAVQEARLHMLEIANSARQPWVAYGDGHPRASWSPAARHFQWRLLPRVLSFGNRARTELGSFPPPSMAATAARTTSQIWSGQQNSLDYDFSIAGFGFSGRVPLFSFVAVDQIAPTVSPFTQSYFGGFDAGTVLKGALYMIFPPLAAMQGAIAEYVDETKPNPATDNRVFALSPYVYFAAHAQGGPSSGPLGELGNFAQPDVLIGLAKQGKDYNDEPGAASTAGRRFSWDGHAAGAATTDFRYGDKDWPQIEGMPKSLQVLHRGLNAFAAAQVYYHRPGDWKEQPNFFNPLWGARLMPVLESNVAGKIGLTSAAAAAIFQRFLLH
ncbi:MAG TPA: pilus assembly protein TadG-related protein [Myxococcales bacterium]|nr:pilus assembly protein TadG-related protein [Myxococcales bacterium]